MASKNQETPNTGNSNQVKSQQATVQQCYSRTGVHPGVSIVVFMADPVSVSRVGIAGLVPSELQTRLVNLTAELGITSLVEQSAVILGNRVFSPLRKGWDYF